jgi:SAM-dependent methyltransferase
MNPALPAGRHEPLTMNTFLFRAGGEYDEDMENINDPRSLNKLSVFAKKVMAGNNPENFWDEAIMLAREEEALAGTDKYFKDINVDEIVSFGERMKKLNTVEEKYRLMMEKTNSGTLWYDVLLGPGNSALFSLTKTILKDEARVNGKFKSAADIGAGTGDTLRAIAPFCQHAYGVDFAEFSVRAARDKGLPANTSIVVANAGHFPFTDQQLDLVVSNGLLYYLTPAETEQYVREMHRVLRRGGKYYNTLHMKEDNEIVPRLSLDVLESAKAALIDIVARIGVNEWSNGSMGDVDYHKLLLANGFAVTNGFKNTEMNLYTMEYTRQ